MAVRGAVHSSVVTGADGAPTAERGSGGDVAADGLAWARRTAEVFGGRLEDAVLTTAGHHHLARALGGPSGSPPDLAYLCVRRGHGTLATARRELATSLDRLGTLPAALRPAALPRRRDAAPAQPPPVPPPATAADPVLARTWAGDVDTVRRLLTALVAWS